MNVIMYMLIMLCFVNVDVYAFHIVTSLLFLFSLVYMYLSLSPPLSLLFLSLSFSQGNIPIFQLLIKKGASLFDKDNASRTVMHWAATSGNVRQQTMMTQQIYNIPVQLYNDNTIMCIHVYVHVHCMYIYMYSVCV